MKGRAEIASEPSLAPFCAVRCAAIVKRKGTSSRRPHRVYRPVRSAPRCFPPPGGLRARLRLHADDVDTTRSAATRTALESVVFDLPPEHPEVHARIDQTPSDASATPAPQPLDRRLVVRHAAIRTVLHGPHRPEHPVLNPEPELASRPAEGHASGQRRNSVDPLLQDAGSCLRAISSPACQPGARPPAGG